MLEKLYADVSPAVAGILSRALDGVELSDADALHLLTTEGADAAAFLRAADVARREDCGDDVSYVVCRNINFTNVCYVGCSFCGFARHKEEEDAFDHPMRDAEFSPSAGDAVARGATEVCIQGGIHPGKDHARALPRDPARRFKRGAIPTLHIHAYSPEETRLQPQARAACRSGSTCVG